MAELIILTAIDASARNSSDIASLENLLNHQYRIRYAQTGSDALTMLSKEHVALIYMDIDRSSEEGFDLLATVRSDTIHGELPIIFRSLDTSGEVELRALKMGATDFVHAAIAPKVLHRRMLNAIDRANCADIDRAYREAIEMIAVLGRYKDLDTHAHVNRISQYAYVLATEYGLDHDTAELIRQAAPLHDTGKIGIPDKILQSTGRLNLGQMEIIKTHSEIGYHILSQSRSKVFRLAAELALHHHERWDGSGYPNGISGLDIPLSARIVSIVDVFDAITSNRSYKKAWPLEDAFEYIRENKGSIFDPELVKSFINCRPEIEAIYFEHAA